MFFGNPQLLERHLNNDLNTFIKNVKAREDQHLSLLQYNKALIAQLLTMDSIPFLQEEIAKHKGYYTLIQASHEEIRLEETELIDKYECTSSGEPSIGKLMSRAIARVLQICQASLDKSKFLDDTLTPKFQQLKNFMLKSISEQKIQIQLLLCNPISYLETKTTEEMKKLNEIIRILIEGDFCKLEQIYKPPEVKQEVKKPPLPEKKEPVKRSLDKSKEKQRVEKIKEQTKKAEQIKKKKTKLVGRMLTQLYNTMDIAKGQLNEDMVFRNPQEQRRRLYDDIMSRNKINHEHILSFECKREEFERKVKEFKEMMQRQSEKIQQALVIKPVSQPKMEEKDPEHSEQIAIMEPNSEDECEILVPEKEKMFRRRDKKDIKIPSPQLVKDKGCSSMQSTQEGFQHIKFDSNNKEIFPRSNRAKLPQISGRSSLDNRYEKRQSARGKSDAKDEKKINIMKNVEIGSMNSIGNGNFIVNNESNRKSPRDRSLGLPMFDIPSNTPSQMIGGFDFTFYGRKKGNSKFAETKNNFLS